MDHNVLKKKNLIFIQIWALAIEVLKQLKRQVIFESIIDSEFT